MKNIFYFIIVFSLLGISSKSFGQKLIPSGKLNDNQIFFEFAIYFSKDSKVQKSDVVNLIKKNYSNIEILDSMPMPGMVKKSQLFMQEIIDVENEFKAPDLNYLKYFGHGMSEEQKQILQSSSYVIVFDFFCEEDQLFNTLKNANQLLTELPLHKNDILFDSETRECFTKSHWFENRINNNKNIDVTNHITMHLYPNGDYCRVITLGMIKFGLPDIVIENVSCQSDYTMMNLVNLVAQTTLEKKYIDKAGKLKLDIESISNSSLKSFFMLTLEDNAEKSAEVNLIEGKWEEGDPENRLIEIAFSKINPQVEHDSLTSKLFGFKDEITYASHDDEIKAASQRAKDKLPELYEKFSKRLPETSSLYLKFKFTNKNNEGEWMWVEIIKWESDMVQGLLNNDPQVATHLKSGQMVSKNVNEMFDYIFYHSDGTQEGNETGKIMLFFYTILITINF